MAGAVDAPIVVITPSGREAQELYHCLAAFVPRESLEMFPAWETLPHERLSPRADTVAARLRTLRRLAHPEEYAPLKVVVMPVRSWLQPVVAHLGDLVPVRISRGDTYPMEQLVHDLVSAAYTRVDMVERRGEFAVRGGIVDVFSPIDPHPVRLEFFGDEIDDMRSFSVADQRSLSAVDTLYAPPCRELLLDDDVRRRAAELVESLPGAVDMLDQIAQGIAVEGMESLTPALVPEMTPIYELLPSGSPIAYIEPERIEARAESLISTTEEFLAAAWTSAAAGGVVPVDVSKASFITMSEASAGARGHLQVKLSGFAGDAEDPIVVAATEPQRYMGDMAAMARDLHRKLLDGWAAVVITEGLGIAQRFAESLVDMDLTAVAVETLPKELQPGVLYVTPSALWHGVVVEKHKLALFSVADLTGRDAQLTRDMRKMPTRRKKAVDPLSLTPGDYVVHERHGIGRFLKLAQRTSSNGTQREYVVIEYLPSKRGLPNDELWIPTDSLDAVTRYTGGEAPRMNKMGGADWENTKSRARSAVKDIADELVRLYAKRQATKGYAFSPDTPWQHELEDAFAYTETPDQLSTIDDVKADMEKPVPMDRLISGDVGYGKTEIAVRAAFKAVQDGKQVAVLAPTTLLAQQHGETFEERYAGFPVTVGVLSRFQSEREANEIRAGIHSGKIDVAIGTHRLLGADVRFKDLGLVIIDEEQRFGVEHKETLKQLYPAVDVLAMSATPIPRTLEMAVTGIREMSTLATPPEERHPVLTYVGRHEDRQVIAAIRRELLRDGQVFYIHNRVQSINRVAKHLQELVPEARIGVAHGKMGEAALEEVINSFWHKEIDVLVCTTIVETGLDIANANTLIVENAHTFGLSQLHQLRGRVGRSRERAYAYFLYPPDKTLTETAIERLRTIAAHTELGAGIQVAMKDLEIRGAGNLLGGQQSGHIAGVGFDLYIRMIAEAVGALKGDGEEPRAEVRVEIPVDAYVPPEYVSAEPLRLEIYQKIASAANDSERGEVRGEIVDRYGPIPEPVDKLFTISRIREKARAAGVGDVTALGNGSVRFSPVILPASRMMRLRRLHPRAQVKAAVRAIVVPMPTSKRLGAGGFGGSGSSQGPDDAAVLAFIESVLDEVFLADAGSESGAGGAAAGVAAGAVAGAGSASAAGASSASVAGAPDAGAVRAARTTARPAPAEEPPAASRQIGKRLGRTPSTGIGVGRTRGYSSGYVPGSLNLDDLPDDRPSKPRRLDGGK